MPKIKINKPPLTFLLFALCIFVSYKEDSVNILISAVVFYFVGKIVLHLQKETNSDNYFISDIFTYAYALRLLSTIIIYYVLYEIRGEPFLIGGDDNEYETVGQMISRSWSFGKYEIPKFLYKSGYYPGYYIVNGFVHYIFDSIGSSHVLIVRFFNCLVGALIPVYVYKTAKRVYDIKVSKVAAYLTLFYPGLIFYSSIQHKEVIIAFLFTFALYNTIEFVQNHMKIHMGLAIASIVTVSFFRYPYAVILGLICSSCIIISMISKDTTTAVNETSKFRPVKITAIFLLLFSIALLGIKGEINISLTRKSIGLAEQIDAFNMHSFGQFMKPGMSSTSLGLSYFESMPTPVRQAAFTFFMLISPYPPWHSLYHGDAMGVVYFLAGVFWLSVVPFTVFGLIYTIRNRMIETFPIYSTFVVMLIVVGITYFGPRYRVAVMPLGFILTALGLHAIRKFGWKKLYFLGFHFGLLGLYLLLKYRFIGLDYLFVFLCAAIVMGVFQIRRRSV